MLRNAKGFTLIELMVVVVIIGILAAIALPNFMAMQDRAKEAAVKSNAHTVQLSVEDFKTKQNGNKPQSFAAVESSTQATVPTTIRNPFDTNIPYLSTIVVAAATANYAAYVAPAANAVSAGNLQYTYVDQATPYVIQGFGKSSIATTLSEGQ